MTKADREATKALLRDYPRLCRTITVYQAKESLTKLEVQVLLESKKQVEEMNAAFELILDEEVKDIIKHRYVKARKHKLTIATYRATSSEATINRRIDVGVESIAECLKLAGII
ncbi:hypothetical protein NYE25_14445 [Paenibacillus sp. FSL E2-8871]|uniref:hypothetical protein n=1 Tax=Paenibacillus sp. FSL E2-8871 TaxID=2975326 RepID=UPI0030FA51B8